MQSLQHCKSIFHPENSMLDYIQGDNLYDAESYASL